MVQHSLLLSNSTQQPLQERDCLSSSNDQEEHRPAYSNPFEYNSFDTVYRAEPLTYFHSSKLILRSIMASVDSDPPRSSSSKRIEGEINEILLQQPVDLQVLRSYSRKIGGFQNNKLRSRVWPKLLGINRFNVEDYRNHMNMHKDHSQVRADVERSLWSYEPMKFWKESYRNRRRKVLAEIIIAILSRNDHLHYYQGFHDIVSTIMLVIDDDFLAFTIAEFIALHFISDYMKETFETVSKFMHILFVIIRSQDYDLYNHLVEAKMEPFFAISWLITWFSHDIKEIDDVARLYDVLLSSPPIYCFYISAAYILGLKKEIMETDPDFAIMHNLLIKAPSKFDFQIEETIARADDLYNKLPFSKVLPLCDRGLFKIITCNNISLFEKPSFQISSVDSDWKLLEDMKVSGWQNPQYWRSYFQYSLGWNIPALFSSSSSSSSYYSYDENLLDGIEEDHPKSKFYLFYLKKLLARRSQEESQEKEEARQQQQKRRPSTSQRRSARLLPFLSFNQILWSFTIVIGGVLGYFLMFGNPPLLPPSADETNPLSE